MLFHRKGSDIKNSEYFAMTCYLLQLIHGYALPSAIRIEIKLFICQDKNINFAVCIRTLGTTNDQ